MKNQKNDALGSRMKTYEAVPKTFLTIGIPKIVRLDMRAGHTFCRGFKKPFDDVFSYCMTQATKALCQEVPGVVMGYTQSDEISLVLNDETTKGTFQCFFDGNLEKIVSLTASICTIAFNKAYIEVVTNMPEGEDKELYSKNLWKAQFDSRVFGLPTITEVHNYILWIQLDATRNSIQMAGHSVFTDSELHLKNTSDIQDMLMLQKGINWNDYPVKYKRGLVVVKQQYIKEVKLPNGEIIPNVKRKRWVEAEIPILTKDTEYIKKIFKKWLLNESNELIEV